MRILRNEVFEAEGHVLLGNSRYRILDVSPEHDVAILFQLDLRPDPKKPFIVGVEDLEHWESTSQLKWSEYQKPLIMTLDEAQISRKKKAVREERYESISPLISKPGFLLSFASEQRSSLVADEARAQSVRSIDLYRVLYRFWEFGQTSNALLDNTEKCGGPGKDRQPGAKQRGAPAQIGTHVRRSRRSVNITPDDVKTFVEALRLVVLKVKADLIKFTYVNVYLEVKSFSPYRDEIILAAEQGRAAQIPTMRQFRYWLNKVVDRVEIDRSILPRHVWTKDHRGLTSSATILACVPGSRYEIDSTIADVYIVSEFNRNIVLGRPTIYAVVCVSSRMVVGFHVSLKWASWKCARQALYNAFTDKVAFCERNGLAINEQDWASVGVPTRVFADRGEMIGDQPKVLTRMLGANIEIAPPLRSDAKGIVEREFGIANETLHIIPGTTLGQLKERGYPDYRLKAVLTLNELTTALCSKFHLNNTTTLYDDILTEDIIGADLAPTPSNFWNFHVNRQQHSLKYFEKDEVIAGLLPSVAASVCRNGIVSQGIRFSCERAEAEEWFSRARHLGRWKLEARGDMGWSSDLYIRVEGESNFLKCHPWDAERLTRCRHPDDLEFLNEWNREKKEDGSIDLAKLEHKDRIDNIVKKATDEKMATPTELSEWKRTQGIQERRRAALVDPLTKEPAKAPSTRRDDSRAVNRNLRLISCQKDSLDGDDS